MFEYVEQFRRVQQHPGMYFYKPTYEHIMAYVAGFDAALSGSVFMGFREWLVTVYGVPSNLHWTRAVAYAIWPGHNDPLPRLRRPSVQKQAIDRVFELMFAFFEYRDKSGLRVVFLDYERWLRKQPWYDADSPEWYEWGKSKR